MSKTSNLQKVECLKLYLEQLKKNKYYKPKPKQNPIKNEDDE